MLPGRRLSANQGPRGILSDLVVGVLMWLVVAHPVAAVVVAALVVIAAELLATWIVRMLEGCSRDEPLLRRDGVPEKKREAGASPSGTDSVILVW